MSCVILDTRKLLVANTAGDSISIISFDEDGYHVKTKSIFQMLKNNKCLKGIDRVEKIGIHQLYNDEEETDIIYTVNSYDNSIFKINIKKYIIEAYAYVGKFPTHLAIFKDRIFIANSDSNSVSVVDKKTFELIENISVGEKPHGLILDNNNLYVANSNGYSMDIINLDDYTIKRKSLPYNPLHFYMYKDKLYIIAAMSNGMLNSYMIIYSTVENRILKKLSINNMIYNIIYKADINCIYTPNVSDGYLYKIEFGEVDYIKKYYIGGMPCNLVDMGECIYISDVLNNQIIVFNYKNETMETKLSVDKEPNGLLII